MTILAGYFGGLTSGDHAVDGFMQKGVEVFAVLRELVDFVYRCVASLRSGLHMLSFKPLSWGHVLGLGADWSLATHSPSSRSSSRGQNPALAGAIAPRGHRGHRRSGRWVTRSPWGCPATLLKISDCKSTIAGFLQLQIFKNTTGI